MPNPGKGYMEVSMELFLGNTGPWFLTHTDRKRRKGPKLQKKGCSYNTRQVKTSIQKVLLERKRGTT